jgi:hypothetical protein
LISHLTQKASSCNYCRRKGNKCDCGRTCLRCVGAQVSCVYGRLQRHRFHKRRDAPKRFCGKFFGYSDTRRIKPFYDQSFDLCDSTICRAQAAVGRIEPSNSGESAFDRPQDSVEGKPSTLPAVRPAGPYGMLFVIQLSSQVMKHIQNEKITALIANLTETWDLTYKLNNHPRTDAVVNSLKLLLSCH